MGVPRPIFLAVWWWHYLWAVTTRLPAPAHAYPPSLAGPVIPRATLDRVFPTSTPVDFEIGSAASQGDAGPMLTLVGAHFTEEYGAGSLRCRFNLEEGPVTVCAERTTAGCVSSATDQTRLVGMMILRDTSSPNNLPPPPKKKSLTP